MAPLLFIGLGALFGAAFVTAKEEVKGKAAALPPASSRPTFAMTAPNGSGVLGADPAHSPSGGPVAPRAGVQSHPDYQWTYVVQSATDSPGAIAEKILGAEQAWRYVELLTANGHKPIKGKVVSPDPGADELNFTTLAVGEKLLIPRTWNGWLDETGVPAGKSQPWPAPRKAA